MEREERVSKRNTGANEEQWVATGGRGGESFQETQRQLSPARERRAFFFDHEERRGLGEGF